MRSIDSGDTMEAAMDEQTWREAGERPYDGETRKLAPPPQGRRSCAPFPWKALWLIWPLIFVLKGGFLLAAPALAWLSRPVLLTVTPLPLILVGVGVLLLLGSRRRRAG
jgi:hypothetical protein